MRNILSLILMALLLLLVGALAIALILAWAVGLGWLLSQIVPFSWFEATLLMLIASIVVGYTAVRLLSMPTLSPRDLNSAETPFHLPEPIPLERFTAGKEDVTDEAWFRFEMANEIFVNLDNLERELAMGEAQQKELAIRLTDVAVSTLKKRKTGRRATSVRITMEQMVKEMEAMGQQPYDMDILETAVASINVRLSYDEDLTDVVRDKTWNSID